jgi:hypothetical protein
VVHHTARLLGADNSISCSQYGSFSRTEEE